MGWKTRPLESLKNLLRGRAEHDSRVAGGLISDRLIAPALHNIIRPTAARALWNELRWAAQVASTPDGGLTQLANTLQSPLVQMPRLEVHLIDHSAGSLLLGPLVASHGAFDGDAQLVRDTIARIGATAGAAHKTIDLRSVP